MKKVFKKLFVFLMVFALVGIQSLSVSEVANAAAFAPRDENDTENAYSDPYGSVQITKGGDITVTYKHGFTELLITATRCTQYRNSNGGEITQENLGEATACDSFINGKTEVIHVSGSINTTNSDKSVKVKLMDYNIGWDEIVEVKIIVQFIDTKDGQETHTGKYYPLFCNKDAGVTNCNPQVGESKYSILGEERIKAYLREASISNYNINWVGSRKQLVYSGVEVDDGVIATDGRFSKVNNSPITIKPDNMPVTYIKNASTDTEDSTNDIDSMIYDTIIPALMIILFTAAGVSIAVYGYKIVKSADEPQERREKINALKNILIGIGIALLLLFASGPVVNFIRGVVEKS